MHETANSVEEDNLSYTGNLDNKYNRRGKYKVKDSVVSRLHIVFIHYEFIDIFE